ncbi:hypothetical protein BDV93DRAFT_606043 [Ceratobasidium sp. AG-I]|nr:hypothetical protein BDV93DRAFT_606043 [Ceratobasidium sp. AG-I]
MPRKTGATTSLSNGTLSLRFMQRGSTQRVTTVSAKVTDEAEWDIGPEARAAWGVTSGLGSGSTSQSSSIHVTRDDSYIPFMFDRDTSGSTSRQDLKTESDVDQPEPGRRRIFRQGTEVTFEPPVKTDQKVAEESESKDEGEAKDGIESSGQLKPTVAQPKTISDTSTEGVNEHHPAPVPSGTQKPRRHRLEGFLKPPGGSAPAFVKPAGVVSAAGAGTKRTRDEGSTPRDGGRGKDIRRRRS